MAKDKIEFSEALMAKYGDVIKTNLDERYSWTIYLYPLNWFKIAKLSNISDWLAMQYESNEIQPLKSLVEDSGWWDMYNDEKIVRILRWVHDNIEYVTDKDHYGIDEYWGTAFEVFTTRMGDCEDHAVLIYILARLAGVPDTNIRLVAGNVIAPDGKMFGHSYIIYKSDTDTNILNDNWKIIDSTAYYDSKWVPQRKYYKDDKRYADVWFQVNSTRYYGLYKLK